MTVVKLPRRLVPTYPDNPQPGMLCVWHAYNSEMDRYKVDSVDEAKKLIDRLSRAQLHDKNVVMNAFGLEVYMRELKTWKGGREPVESWEEWYNDDGDDIIGVMVSDSAT